MRNIILNLISNCKVCFAKARFDKVLSLFAVLALLVSCLASAGCDLGTYNQRLNEKPVAPVEEPAEDEGGTDEEGGDQAEDADDRGDSPTP